MYTNEFRKDLQHGEEKKKFKSLNKWTNQIKVPYKNICLHTEQPEVPLKFFLLKLLSTWASAKNVAKLVANACKASSTVLTLIYVLQHLRKPTREKNLQKMLLSKRIC